jgi:hypothetical protein
MLRRTAVIAALIVVLSAAEHAAAEPIKTLNQNLLVTAESIDPGMTQVGFHFVAGEGYQSFYPAIRYGLGAFFEIGGRFGITSADVGSEDKTGELIGVDVKYQMIKQTDDIPVDVALGVGFDTNFINSENLSDLTFTALFSRAFPLTDGGYKITPYGGAQFSSLSGSYLDSRETDFYVFAGMEWKMTQKSMLYLEIKAGDSTVGGVGVRFEY